MRAAQDATWQREREQRLKLRRAPVLIGADYVLAAPHRGGERGGVGPCSPAQCNAIPRLGLG